LHALSLIPSFHSAKNDARSSLQALSFIPLIPMREE
jgi:hypothetical protein